MRRQVSAVGLQVANLVRHPQGLEDRDRGREALGHPLFEIWINEGQTGDGSQAAWDHCMAQSVDCDIFLALFNGNAGWEDSAGTVGICHAELEKAYSMAPGKVFIVNIHEPADPAAPARDMDRRFQHYVAGLRQFEARNVTTGAALVDAVNRTLSQAVVKMVQRGVQGASLGRQPCRPGAGLEPSWVRAAG